MEKNNSIKKARRIHMLYLIDADQSEKLPWMDPENYQKDMDFLEKHGFIKKVGSRIELDSRGRNLMKKVTLKQKFRYRRYLSVKNKNP